MRVFLGFMLICCLLRGFGDMMISCSAQLEPTLPESEVQALRSIASKLRIGPELWNFSLNPCSGEGGWLDVPRINTTTAVTKNLTCGDCSNATGVCHVVAIVLKSTNLTGVLPPEFADLTHLSFLDLTRNVLTESIPVTWGSLPLTSLILLGNQLSGKIPDEIGNITTLRVLSLEDNLLEGSIPRSFGNLTRLSRLLLSANNFDGELPDTMGNMKQLTELRIDGNSISGKIPHFIGNWSQLSRLDMQGTSLEGPFPPTLSNLTKLLELRVTDFKGDGAFPPLNQMNLKNLVLRNCSIFGLIPAYIGLMSNLLILDLSFNSFSGEIPSTLQLGMIHFSKIYLTNNMLNGTIPEWLFGNIKIDLSYNFFTGPDVSSCQVKDVNLVSSFSPKKNPVKWCLMKNLPCSKKATNYQLFINCGGGKVTIDGNHYEEDINGSGESVFVDYGNWAYSSTGEFVGDQNGRATVSNTSALRITTPQLYTSARTSASSLKYYGLCLRRGNYTVKLHFAEIIFTDDSTYSSVGRRFFDVFIQGEKVLEDFNIAMEAKGTGREIVKVFNASVDSTLEIHFRWSGKGTNAIPGRGLYGPLISAISVTPNFEVKKKSVHVGVIAGIVICSCMLIFLVIYFIYFILIKTCHENDQDGIKDLKLQGYCFTLRQIKSATKNFDPANKIGEGGFGPVYKGILSNGTVVAVKQLSSRSKQGNREFVTEIGMISAVDHPNLVKLYGCCIEGNQLLLVYEYMENNSLARALFGSKGTRLDLDWKTRRMICLHIARGLAYLHEESSLKIVHRDIKATNVLLDKDLNAKISDFGLAKLTDEEKSHITTRIAGTIGYMAPEYASRGYLTEKADVYSFGVVVLEIVSGKCNTDHLCNDSFMHLIDWAYVLQEQGRILELVDTSLGSDYSRKEAEQMLSLALQCTKLSPAFRPRMTEVVLTIEGGVPVPVPVSSPFDPSDQLMMFRYSSQFPSDFSGPHCPLIHSSATNSASGDATIVYDFPS